MRTIRWIAVSLLLASLLMLTTPAWGQLEAVTVPWLAADPSDPHYSYSGIQTRLKGIARGGAVEFEWDFGDGSPPVSSAISNPYVLEATHVYTGLPGDLFIATLTVRNAGGDEDQDSYLIQLYESFDLTIPEHLQVRVNMAIDEGLWWLHKNLIRQTYGGGAPGYGQPYGYWSDSYPLAATCTALDAFQLHGSKANGDYPSDPYVETVQRSLNYLLTHTYSYAIGPQTHGDPDSNGNGLGLVANHTSYQWDTRQTYIGGICAVAMASSGAPNRDALVGGANVYMRDYKDIVQDMVDFFAWGQVDGGNGRGGWRYYGNYNDSDMSTTQWPPLAMIAAETNMGSDVPSFVRSELEIYLNASQYMSCNNNHGAFWYRPIYQAIPNCTKAAAGIISHQFLGTPLDDPRVEAALGYLYRHWNDTGSSWENQRLFGNSYGMYGVMKAMRNPQPDILEITEYNCSTGDQTANAFDWYYAPASAPRDGLATYIVQSQQSDGSWDDVGGPNPVYNGMATGWRILTLEKGVTCIPPRAEICDCDEQEYNLDQDIHLDGSCSTHPDPNRTIVSYEWDLDDDGVYDFTGIQASIPGGFPVTDLYPVTLRVADENPDCGSQSGTHTCQVDVHPPPHCPHAFADGPYQGFVGVPIQFDASASWDPDNEILLYEWDLDNDGLFGTEDGDSFGQPSDAVGVQPHWTWTEPFLGVIGLRITDGAGEYPPCTDFDYTTVEIGNHPPVADPNGPYDACLGCTISLDGSGSYDIDPGDEIVLYEWDLDNDGEFDDANGATPPYKAGMTPDVIDICLRVADTFGEYDVHCTTIEVLHNQPCEPVGQDAAFEANEDCVAYVTAADIDGGSYDPDGDPIDLIVMPPGPFGPGDHEVNLCCEDPSGQRMCDPVMVTVLDLTPPDITCPAELWLECPADTSPSSTGTALAEDNCGPVMVDYTDFSIPGPGETEVLTRTWAAEDQYANTDSCDQTITVQDTTPPVLMPPPPIELECIQEGGIALDDPRLVAWFDSATASDSCGDVIILNDAPDPVPEGTTTVLFTATDASGHSVSATSTVTATYCYCEPVPAGQGWWHRQCLGAGLISPGRNGRGPQEPLEPEFLKETLPPVRELLEEKVFVFEACAEGMDADPASDPCQRALKRYTSMLFDLESHRTQIFCEVDVSSAGCTSTDVAGLIDELAALINSGIGSQCSLAAACAGAVNEGALIPSEASTVTDTSQTTEPDATSEPSLSTGRRVDGLQVPPIEPAEPEVTTAAEANKVLFVAPVAEVTETPPEAVTTEAGVEAAMRTTEDDLATIEQHLAVLASTGSTQQARSEATEALLTALSGGYDPEVRIGMVKALIGKVDIGLHSLLVQHLEAILREAKDFELKPLASEAIRLLEKLDVQQE